MLPLIIRKPRFFSWNKMVLLQKMHVIPSARSSVLGSLPPEISGKFLLWIPAAIQRKPGRYTPPLLPVLTLLIIHWKMLP